MTVNYTVMHWNTSHYAVEYTATHCSSENKARRTNLANVIRLHTALAQNTTAYCKKVLRDTNIKAETKCNYVKHTEWQNQKCTRDGKPQQSKCDCYKNIRRSLTGASWRYYHSLKLCHFEKR